MTDEEIAAITKAYNESKSAQWHPVSRQSGKVSAMIAAAVMAEREACAKLAEAAATAKHEDECDFAEEARWSAASQAHAAAEQATEIAEAIRARSATQRTG